jgi:hypothetical protein
VIPICAAIICNTADKKLSIYFKDQALLKLYEANVYELSEDQA